jgi:HPt (histidine-containing phosphotransfer) domain-containing protein
MVGGSTHHKRTSAAPRRGCGRREPILDPAALEDLRRLDTEASAFLPTLAGVFLDHAAGLMAKIAVAGAESDLETLRLACHTLKSGSAQFGAHALASACARLEARCVAGAAAEVPSLIAALERAYVPVRRALQIEQERVAS